MSEISKLALFRSVYARIFSIYEIEKEPVLQWMFGASLFFFFFTFDRWIRGSDLTIEAAKHGDAVCWPYLQHCTDFYFLHSIGHGYSQPIFYMILYGVILAIIYCMWKRLWIEAHGMLTLLFLWEVAVVFAFSYTIAAPYFYYHIALTATLLFATHKEFFLKLVYVFLYFVSVTVKLDPTWILGTYFSALTDGLPLFPDALIPLLTNLVIFMQMIGAWFLLSKRRILQRGALIYFVFFHLYSGIFVFYFYPSTSLPPLLILFGPMYRHISIPFTRKTFVGWTIILALALFQLAGFLAPGDRRISLEGNKFGMFMFEANHQCVVTIVTHSREQHPNVPDYETANGTACTKFFCLVKSHTETGAGGSVRTDRYESGTARNRCAPYVWWAKYHDRCTKQDSITKIGLTIDHSINGGAFYRTVDTPNICDVPYYTFGPNTWIQEPPEAPLIGFPVTNTYN